MNRLWASGKGKCSASNLHPSISASNISAMSKCVLYLWNVHWPEWFNFDAWSHKCASHAQTRPGLLFTLLIFLFSHFEWHSILSKEKENSSCLLCFMLSEIRKARNSDLDMDTVAKLTVPPWPECQIVSYPMQSAGETSLSRKKHWKCWPAAGKYGKGEFDPLRRSTAEFVSWGKKYEHFESPTVALLRKNKHQDIWVTG